MNISKMLPKKISVIIIFGCIISLAFVIYINVESSANKPLPNIVVPIVPTIVAVYKSPRVNYELPSLLTIPSIGVDSGIEYVGVASDGSMGVPKGPANVAWFRFGPRPGEIGSAVIAGHSGWKDGIPAVFDNLDMLRVGDKVYIEDEKGQTITFVVREIRTYDPKRDSEDVFVSTDGKAHLNLVTCSGLWNTITKGRPDRLVVFTDKE